MKGQRRERPESKFSSGVRGRRVREEEETEAVPRERQELKSGADMRIPLPTLDKIPVLPVGPGGRKPLPVPIKPVPGPEPMPEEVEPIPIPGPEVAGSPGPGESTEPFEPTESLMPRLAPVGPSRPTQAPIVGPGASAGLVLPPARRIPSPQVVPSPRFGRGISPALSPLPTMPTASPVVEMARSTVSSPIGGPSIGPGIPGSMSSLPQLSIPSGTMGLGEGTTPAPAPAAVSQVSSIGLKAPVMEIARGTTLGLTGSFGLGFGAPRQTGGSIFGSGFAPGRLGSPVFFGRGIGRKKKVRRARGGYWLMPELDVTIQDPMTYGKTTFPVAGKRARKYGSSEIAMRRLG